MLRRYVPPSPLERAIALFLVAATVATLAAHYRHVALREYRLVILEPIAFYVLALALLRDTRAMARALWAVAGAGLLVAVLGLGQYVLRPDTLTGGRIKRLKPYLEKGTFMLTWCDGISDVDLAKLLDFHRAHGKLATVTVVRAPSRFGVVDLADDGAVQRFSEKPAHGDGWINGAFFVLEPGIFDYIAGDQTMWEREPLEQLALDGELVAYRHHSFWQCMDTLREKMLLEEMWQGGAAPWKTWE